MNILLNLLSFVYEKATEKTAAYEQGNQAYRDGCSLEMNPHQSNPEKKQWIEGYYGR